RGQTMLFGFGPEADFQNPGMNIAYAVQAGLGLPDRDYYFDDKYAEIRAAYVEHIGNVLVLSGIEAAQAREMAQAVMDFETRLAKVSLSSEELSRDISNYYNPVTLDHANEDTPTFSWTACFEDKDIEAPKMFSLTTPDFHAELSRMIADVP